jgi:hypothetical protein
MEYAIPVSSPNLSSNNEEYNFLKMMQQNDSTYNKVKKMNKTQLSNNSKNPRQSEINEQLLNLYTEIDIEYNNFKNKLSSTCFKHKLINIDKINRTLNQSILNQSILKSSYIPSKIVKFIKEKSKIVLEYNCGLDNGRTVKINFIIFENSNYEINNIKKKSASYFKNCVLKIYIWLSILSKYADAKCGKNLECFIYLTPFKRKLPKVENNDSRDSDDNHDDDDDEDDDNDRHDNREGGDHEHGHHRGDNEKVFKPLHVNGGVSDVCQTNGQIVVYRKEEWFKVFMHETMHNYGMDFSTLDISSANRKLKTIFSIQTHIKIFESYCEIWARIMNVFFECYFDIHRHSLALFKPLTTRKKITNNLHRQHAFSLKKQPRIVSAIATRDNKDKKNIFLNMFYNFMQHESVFSLFQCVKILNFMGLDYNIISTCNAANNSIVKKFYKEETNVFAYYIIVAILISNFNNFILWCIDNNTNLINFKQEQSSIDSFIRFISENYKNNDLLKSIVGLEHKLANHVSSHHVSNDKILLNTMRMTVIGGG